MNALGWISFILVVIGGLNWGLVGALNFNLVDSLFGVGSLIAQIVYILVGLGALGMIIGAFTMKD
ncbi:MAG TPA: DUF378 domain-containing protein [Candidatus Omnitrophota bacterium]|nr:DUF378 domain-containing protein [Candidatus Omnitrophota bacterium]